MTEPADTSTPYGPGTYWRYQSSGLNLVGEAIDSPYPSDMPYVEAERKRGNIFGAWYSEGTFGGHEVGTNPAYAVSPITEEQFLAVLDELGATRYTPPQVVEYQDDPDTLGW